MVGDSFKNSVVSTVAAVLGMIPEGLVLLTSVALTLGALSLAKRKTLVQELYCIETLARVDTLCLDKTGTITEGSMCVEQVILLEPADFQEDCQKEESEKVNLKKKESQEIETQEIEDAVKEDVPDKEREDVRKGMSMDELNHVMQNLMGVLSDSNATADAHREHFRRVREITMDHADPFSSERKYSGACVEGRGNYRMGAVQDLFLRRNEKLDETCKEEAGRGKQD